MSSWSARGLFCKQSSEDHKHQYENHSDSDLEWNDPSLAPSQRQLAARHRLVSNRIKWWAGQNAILCRAAKKQQETIPTDFLIKQIWMNEWLPEAWTLRAFVWL